MSASLNWTPTHFPSFGEVIPSMRRLGSAEFSTTDDLPDIL